MQPISPSLYANFTVYYALLLFFFVFFLILKHVYNNLLKIMHTLSRIIILRLSIYVLHPASYPENNLKYTEIVTAIGQ